MSSRALRMLSCNHRKYCTGGYTITRFQTKAIGDIRHIFTERHSLSEDQDIHVYPIYDYESHTGPSVNVPVPLSANKSIPMDATTLQRSELLEDSILENLYTICYIRRLAKACILLNVSGGIDSMAMLHMLGRAKQRLKENCNIDFYVVNFNHKMRPEADSEELLVEEWANFYKFPFYKRQLDPVEKETGFQDYARNWRKRESLNILDSICQGKSYSDRVVATAHHEDDQLETTLLKLLRGTHISNLYPMPARSEDNKFIRPLIQIRKGQITEYMLSNNFPWSEDSSNSSRKYKRNKIRLDLIPMMADIAGGEEALRRRFANLASQSLDVRLSIQQQAETYLKDNLSEDIYKVKDRGHVFLSIKKFESVSHLVRSQVIVKLITLLTGKSVTSEIINSIISLSLEDLRHGYAMKSIDVSKYWFVRKYNTGQVLEFRRKGVDSEFNNYAVTKADDIILVSLKEFQIKLGKVHEEKSKSQSHQKFMRLRNVAVHIPYVPKGSILLIRYPKQGDVCEYRNGPQSLTTVLKNSGIPGYLRNYIPIVTSIDLSATSSDETQDSIINKIQNSKNDLKEQVFLP